MKFAEIVVNVPLHTNPARAHADESEALASATESGRVRAFTYAIPDPLRDRLASGQLVWVPFGARRVQGIVVALRDTSPDNVPVERIRDVLEIVDPQPFLSETQLALARWIADEYLVPLADAVWLFLPPGIEQKFETLLSLAPDVANANLTDKQKELFSLIVESGTLKLHHLPEPLRNQADKLVEKGLLIKQTRLTQTQAKPKQVRSVHLQMNSTESYRLLDTIARNLPQAKALEYLARNPVIHDRDRFCEQVPCSSEVVKALAEKHWIGILPAQKWYSLSPNFASIKSPSSQKQVKVLDFFRQHTSPITRGELQTLSVESSDLNTLVKRGYLQVRAEPAKIQLLITIDDATENAIRLRGLEKPRQIVNFLSREQNPVWVSALYAATDSNLADLQKLEALGIVALEEEEVVRDPLAGKTFEPTPPPLLTTEQQAVLNEIVASLKSQDTSPAFQVSRSTFLIHGVTGSGKTEIYLRACEEILKQGKQAIALVPEIALTPQTIARFGARFGHRIGVIHSDLSGGERYDTWRRARAGEIDILIGPRSALFAPLWKLGLIVMDEEHEPSYKQESEAFQMPTIHARTVALEYARRAGATVILGSATPDVETYYRATRGEIRLLELPHRIETALNPPPSPVANGGALVPEQSEGRVGGGQVRFAELPPVEIVDMRTELKAGNRSIFSRALQVALATTLNAHQQIILFLNRRGTATFVMCRDCGHVLKCPRCGNPFTYHGAANALVCHHCNQRGKIPTRCPNCHSTRIRYFGAGTEKIEAEVRELFPGVRVLRWDYDVTRAKGSHDEILAAFSRHDADVLIGTQMIAKGLDLPRVTLVGVVSADTALQFPDFRAGERTFQLLVQVAGRAGRSALGGKVIVQTYQPEHYAIQAASRHDYRAFYETEIKSRRELNYPPFARLVRLLYVGRTEEHALNESLRMYRALTERIRRRGLLNLDLIGPAPAFYSKLRGAWRYHLLVRGQNPHALLADLPLPAEWRVDVDPVNLL